MLLIWGDAGFGLKTLIRSGVEVDGRWFLDTHSTIRSASVDIATHYRDNLA
ncbi:hypothetical protein DPMN_104080 [Dreissena polymorpha]|uniref:Uncharacterized protein n=1 Tax=Dreissena polymorpha TaxID=45954 RepID=A0A9D4JZR3_DREPO|nr:hypothetical protein DPMN_104080 [Dreissena polymorpha]